MNLRVRPSEFLCLQSKMVSCRSAEFGASQAHDSKQAQANFAVYDVNADDG
jgi:hypothetical protein